MARFSQDQILPANDIPWALAEEAIAGAAITAADVVIVNGMSNNGSGLQQVIRADADAVLTARGLLYVALGGAASGAKITIVPWATIRGGQASAVNPTGGNIDTTGAAAAGDEVYMTDAGGTWSATVGTFSVQVGEVLVRSATVGVVKLNPNASFGGSAQLAGSEALILTINDDAVLGTNEDPALRLMGGDGAEVIRSWFRQDSSADLSYFYIDNAAGVRRAPLFEIGFPDETGDVDATLRLVSGDGAATKQLNFTLDATNNRGDLTTVAVTAGGATAGTSGIRILSGVRTKNDANAGVPTSGAVTVQSGATSMTTAAATGGASGAFVAGSGATDVTFAAATGGASGTVLIASGDTDISAAVAATGGGTGAVTVRSGHAASTGATATSGSTGSLTVGTGDSTDAASGDLIVQTGTAGTTRGIVDVNTPTWDFITQAMFFDFIDNNAAALTVRAGSAGLTILTVVTTDAAESWNFTSRISTTDGVASGTARRVGGLASGIVASATMVDPAGAGDAAETVVSTYTIPANTIKAGTTIRVDFAYRITVGATVETLEMRLRLGGVGGTVVALSTSADPATGSGSGYAILKGRAAPGAAAEVAHFGVIKNIAAAGSDSTVVQQGPTLTNFATNGSLDLVVTADWANAEAAGGDTVSLEIFDVQVIG